MICKPLYLQQKKIFWCNFQTDLYLLVLFLIIRASDFLAVSYTFWFQVVVPKTYHKYTSRKVLTTQWIDGEKLSQSTASDVGELVNVGVICYLKQVILHFGASL